MSGCAPKLAMQRSAGFCVSGGSFVKAFKPAKIKGFLVHHNRRLPLLVALVPNDALYARETLAICAPVLKVLRLVDETQIASAIVQPIAADVINLHSVRSRCYQSVKAKRCDATGRINSHKIAAPRKALLSDPMSPGNYGDIESINGRKISLGQGDAGDIADNLNLTRLHAVENLQLVNGTNSVSSAPRTITGEKKWL